MRYRIAVIVVLFVVVLHGRIVAQRPHDRQNVLPVKEQFESAAPAQPGGDPLSAGRNSLKQGVSGSNLDAMYDARATFERALTDTNLSPWGHYYIALTDFGIANILLDRGKKHESAASEHLKKAVEHLQIAERDVADCEDARVTAAEVYALLSNVYGRQIALSPIKGIYLGPKAKSILRKAERLAPGNPRVVLSNAISYLKTPWLVGGNREKAIQGFQRAAELFASRKPTDPNHPVWGHSETYIWMGIAYMERKESGAARDAFEKALEIDPDNRWVRKKLSGDLER